MVDSIVESWFAVLGIIDSILGLICLFFFFLKRHPLLRASHVAQW